MSGGLVWVKGSLSGKSLGSVTKPAQRGEQVLQVDNPSAFQIGREFMLQMKDTPDQSLARYLYADDPGPLDNLKSRAKTSFCARVTKVDVAGKRIEFDRPLRTDVRPEWKPQLQSAESSVEEVGIEGLGFLFPNTPYKGHFTELGFNAIAMSGVRNCWARDIRIDNADSGIFLGGVNSTLLRIWIESEREVERSRKATGHHGISLGGQDNLLNFFEYRTRFMHDITVSGSSAVT